MLLLYPEKDFWVKSKKHVLYEWHNDAPLWGYNHTTSWHESGQEVHCYSAHSGDKASHISPCLQKTCFALLLDWGPVQLLEVCILVK